MDPGLETDLPHVERLALANAPRAVRPLTLALLALDSRLAGFVRRGHEPLLAQMRLAWWRDMLRTSRSAWPEGDPLLDLLRGWREPDRLVPLVDGWEGLLGERLERDVIEAFAAGRERAWAALAAEAGASDETGPAARCWALADLVANLSHPDEKARTLEVASGERFVPPATRALRPLAILGGLGRRALARGGAPLLDGRMAALAALRLGMFGR